MENRPNTEICQRIAKIRLETFGPRGKSTFAKRLGLSASTYDYYERSRVPPADVLVRLAELAGVDLRWLLTGEAACSPEAGTSHPAVQRAGRLLGEFPQAAEPLTAFLDILAASMQFPGKHSHAEPDDSPPQPANLPSDLSRRSRKAKTEALAKEGAGPADQPPARPEEQWLPILGRSAAGVPQFWQTQDAQAGITTLAELVARQGRQPSRTVLPARADGAGAETAVAVITMREPDESGVAEFVSAEQIKARHGDAFAVRIDGESMSPDIRHGDIVILSPSCPATDGQAAVVQLENQIGVTCKLYRRSGRDVHLISINEQFAPQVVPAQKVVWALRVLARIRPQENPS